MLIRYSAWVLVSLLLLISISAALTISPKLFWAAAVFVALFLLGLYDFFQKKHTLWRNYRTHTLDA